MRAALITSGIHHDGVCDILSVKIGNTESFATWDKALRWLKARGLEGVGLRAFRSAWRPG